MTQDILDLGKAMYDHASGMDELKRDEDGFIVLMRTASGTDAKLVDLTTNISSLEEKLKKFKAEKAKTEEYQKSDEYKESKKKQSKKKLKKKRENLLEMIFNNADNADDIDEEELAEDGGSYADSKKTKAAKKKAANPDTTLDTTYGKRFSPVVSLLYDSINDFDRVADEIEEELKNIKTRNMYRSSQVSNLLNAKDKKLSAINKLADVAKTLSDLEYKKEKDKKTEEGDSSKLVSNFASKYLSGMFDDDSDDDKKGKKGKKSKSNKKSRSLSAAAAMDEDDDDEEETSVRRRTKEDDEADREIASKLANKLLEKKDKINLSPHEKYIAMEGKYTIAVVANPMNPDDDWKFIALDPKTGKEIKDFKDKYKGLLPKRSDTRMTFNLDKLRAYDKNTAKTYKLLLKD